MRTVFGILALIWLQVLPKILGIIRMALFFCWSHYGEMEEKRIKRAKAIREKKIRCK